MSKKMLAALFAVVLLALPACEEDDGDDVTAARGASAAHAVSGG